MKKLHLLPFLLLLLPQFSFADKTPQQKFFELTCKDDFLIITESFGVLFPEKLTGKLLDCVKNKVGSQCLENSLKIRKDLGLADKYPAYIYADFEFCQGTIKFVGKTDKLAPHAEFVN